MESELPYGIISMLEICSVLLSWQISEVKDDPSSQTKEGSMAHWVSQPSWFYRLPSSHSSPVWSLTPFPQRSHSPSAFKAMHWHTFPLTISDEAHAILQSQSYLSNPKSHYRRFSFLRRNLVDIRITGFIEIEKWLLSDNCLTHSELRHTP